jgi:F0F1-type ATP synthase delta subunit
MHESIVETALKNNVIIYYISLAIKRNRWHILPYQIVQFLQLRVKHRHRAATQSAGRPF